MLENVGILRTSWDVFSRSWNYWCIRVYFDYELRVFSRLTLFLWAQPVQNTHQKLEKQGILLLWRVSEKRELGLCVVYPYTGRGWPGPRKLDFSLSLFVAFVARRLSAPWSGQSRSCSARWTSGSSAGGSRPGTKLFASTGWRKPPQALPTPCV